MSLSNDQFVTKSTNKKLNIILLKTNDSKSNLLNDRYVDYIQKIYESESATSSHLSYSINKIVQINLLKFEFINLNELNLKLNHNLFNNLNNNSYKCLILTSRQTIEAIEECFSDYFNTNKSLNNIDQNEIDTNLNNYNQNKFIIYCVGDSTACRFKLFIKKLKQINPNIENNLIIRLPTNIDDKNLKEGHKQNAIELAKIITQDYEQIKAKLNSDEHVYALYPCSSIRKDDLSNALKQSNINYDEIHVYKTGYSIEGLEELRKNLESSLADKNQTNCLVFFSPSGCEAVFNSTTVSNLILNDLSKFKFLSIGPSTSSKLKSNLNNDLIDELKEPSPQALYEKLKSF